MVAIATTLTTLRERAGLSINRLAEKSGVSKGQISQIEAGNVKSPGADTLDRLARALGYDCPAVFFDSGVLKSIQGGEPNAGTERG